MPFSFIKKEVKMLKMRLQGTKKDIRWFLKKIERDKRWRIANVSDFLADSKLNGKYKRLYIDVYKESK